MKKTTKKFNEEFGEVTVTTIETTLPEMKKTVEDFLEKNPPVQIRLYNFFGFSEKIINHPFFIEYVTDDAVLGWLGHEKRNKELDKMLEWMFFNSIRKSLDDRFTLEDIFVRWLTSTNARHVADELPENYMKIEEYFGLIIKEIYNSAYIYLLPEHTGMLVSTIKLRKKYENKLLR